MRVLMDSLRQLQPSFHLRQGALTMQVVQRRGRLPEDAHE